MSNPPSFQYYPADFDMDTASWTCQQVGAYIRLLNYQWINGALPTKISELARIVRVDSRSMQNLWSAVLAKKFTTNAANMYVNPRLERTRKEQAEYREKQREYGRIGAMAKEESKKKVRIICQG